MFLTPPFVVNDAELSKVEWRVCTLRFVAGQDGAAMGRSMLTHPCSGDDEHKSLAVIAIYSTINLEAGIMKISRVLDLSSPRYLLCIKTFGPKYVLLLLFTGMF